MNILEMLTALNNLTSELEKVNKTLDDIFDNCTIDEWEDFLEDHEWARDFDGDMIDVLRRITDIVDEHFTERATADYKSLSLS